MSFPPVHSELAAYLPGLLLAELSAPWERRSVATTREVQGALLLADISGFTALTQELSSRGPAGAEELTDLLSEFFGRMVELVTAHGGDVVRFAGDALLAIWPATAGVGGAREACARAAAAAQALQAQLAERATVSADRFSLRVAVGEGQLVLRVLGGTEGRWDYLLSGAPVRQVERAISQISPGDVVLSAAAFRAIGDLGVGEEIGEGAVSLLALTAPPVLAAQGSSHLPADVDTVIADFVPAAVRRQVAAGQARWMAELRTVTVLFVGLPDLDTPTPLEDAQAMVAAVQREVTRYGGEINKLVDDGKGSTVVAAFGLPACAHEDDPARGLRAAAGVHARLRALGWRSAVGVATGPVFCGLIGNDRRREFTIIGGDVNLSARLMQAASRDGSGVLVDNATVRAGGAAVATRAMPAIRVKGRVEAVEVHTLADASIAQPGVPDVRDEQLVGRSGERTTLAAGVAAVAANQGGVILVEGEAGIGKSRLRQELVSLLDAAEVHRFVAWGDAVETVSAYHAWRPVFQQWAGDDVGIELLSRRVAAVDPSAEPLTPLLRAVLPGAFEDNDTTARLTGEARADNTVGLLTKLLVAEPGPPTIIVEDAHWFDSSSWALLRAVAREIPSMLVVIFSRPFERDRPVELDLLMRRDGAVHVPLSPLSAADAVRLAATRLGAKALPDEVGELVTGRAEGHPLFTIELALAMRDAGIVVVRDGEAQLTVGSEQLGEVRFPDTLQGVITSRLDRLSPQQQLALKVASVVGRIFAVPVVRRIHPIEADRPALQRTLDVLSRLDLASPTGDADRYAFKHVLTQEVAYNLMAYSQRRRLHRVLVELLVDGGDSAPGLIAHHGLRALADKPEDQVFAHKVLGWVEAAGDRALTDYANVEALGLFTATLDLDERLGGQASKVERARWLRRMADAHYRLGRMVESRKCLREALALLGHPVPTSGLGVGLALVPAFIQQFFYRIGLEPGAARDAEARGVYLEASRALSLLWVLHYQSNEAVSTVHAAVSALNLAERAGPSPELADAYSTVCLIVGTVPMHPIARLYARNALEMAEKQGNDANLAWVLEVLGVYWIGLGRWDRVRELVGRAQQIADDLGDRRRWEETSAVLAWVDYFSGSLPASAGRWREVARSARDRGDPQPHIWGLCGRVEAGLACGEIDLSKSRALLQEAVDRLPGDMYRAEAIRVLGNLARVRLALGDESGAESAANQALDRMSGLLPTTFYSFEGYAGVLEVFMALRGRASGAARRALGRRAWRARFALIHFALVFPIAAPRRRLFGGRWRVARGWPWAWRAWRSGRARAHALGMPREEALLAAEIALSGPDSVRDAARAESVALLESVGAVSATIGGE